MAAKLRLLTISTLYPNPAEPHHGIFVETRLRKLMETEAVEATVIAPVPRPLGRNLGTVPDKLPHEELRHGIRVFHPRYLTPPAMGMYINVFTLRTAVRKMIAELMALGHSWDVIDAHYYYPDGVAIAGALRELGISTPLVITARGTDINHIPQHRLPRKWIQKTADQAAHSITVCEALRQEMIALGLDASKITTLRNGVDLELFSPLGEAARNEGRQQLMLDGTVLLSVGHLIERKGHHFVIEAMQELPEATLLIVGSGPWWSRLQSMAEQFGVAGRVRFVGALEQPALAELFALADVSVLASSREGWANVLLESMACGTPVVATRIWGTPEVVREPAAGRLANERSASALAAAVQDLLAALPARESTRTYAEGFSWDATVKGLHELLLRVRAKAQ